MTFRTRLAASALGVAVLVPPQADAQGNGEALEAWKSQLASLSGGVWMTSNADVEDEGAPDAFGMAFELQPGGISATGCLWGEREGEVTQVFWWFFQGWDPVEGAGLVYQAHPAGMVGIGHLKERGGSEPPLIQEFRSPDGTSFRGGHFERMEGPDTRITRSVQWTDGAWVPGRNDIWHRSRDRDAPCHRA